MGRTKQLTKQNLLDLGITNVTEDGKVFKGDTELKQVKRLGPSNWRHPKPYLYVVIPDKSQKIYLENYGNSFYTYKPVTLAVHRIVWAWFNNEAKEGLVIHHIDGDNTNNNLNNLVEITSEKANQIKTVSRNQYNYFLSDEEILEKRENDIDYYDRKTHKRVKKDKLV